MNICKDLSGINPSNISDGAPWSGESGNSAAAADACGESNLGGTRAQAKWTPCERLRIARGSLNDLVKTATELSATTALDNSCEAASPTRGVHVEDWELDGTEPNVLRTAPVDPHGKGAQEVDRMSKRIH